MQTEEPIMHQKVGEALRAVKPTSLFSFPKPWVRIGIVWGFVFSLWTVNTLCGNIFALDQLFGYCLASLRTPVCLFHLGLSISF